LPENRLPFEASDISPTLVYPTDHQPRGFVAKHKYGFEKRQRELAKIRKRQLKAERRAARAAQSQDEPMPDPDDSSSAPADPQPEE
jgi:hypothetical protein